MDTPLSLQRAKATRETQRSRLEKALVDGNRAAVRRLVKAGWPACNWITAALVCQAAQQPRTDILVAVLEACDEKTGRTAVKKLGRKRDMNALLCLARAGGEPLADELMLLATNTGDAPLMTALDAGCREQPWWEKMRITATSLAAEHEQWEVFAALVAQTSKDTLVRQAPEWARDMVHSDTVSGDQVAQVLDWLGEGQRGMKNFEELLVYAAKFGRVTHLPMLLDRLRQVEDPEIPKVMAEACVEAAIWGSDLALAWLFPHTPPAHPSARIQVAIEQWGQRRWKAVEKS